MDASLIAALRREARPLEAAEDFDYLLACMGEASLVLLGEATHGTREFYQLRAEITRRLVVERGFDGIALEADWPDALRVSRYVQHSGDDMSADQALSGFKRFPQWMWRNQAMLGLVNWLHEHNQHVASPARRCGIYGLDLYSLEQSMRAVVAYLEQADPPAALRARERYSCIDHFAEEPQRYGYATSFGMKPHCEEEVLRQLVEMNRLAGEHLRAGAVPDDVFYAQQNARVARNAEAYYRSMFGGRNEAWNVRDGHMADTLQALREHIGRGIGRPARIVVWAHNSHLGDARATEMGAQGQLNLGQLVRERYRPQDSFLLGFTTHTGSVTAARAWDGAAEWMPVVPSRPDSVEHALHQVGLPVFLLPLRGRDSALAQAGGGLLERAIGVVYRPDSERLSHYFEAEPARQFDAIVHVERSTALAPLERSALWRHEEPAETYPSGL